VLREDDLKRALSSSDEAHLLLTFSLREHLDDDWFLSDPPLLLLCFRAVVGGKEKL
jgi:hypothetical protein